MVMVPFMLGCIRFYRDLIAGYVLSPVAKQMTSNTVVAVHDVMQMCFDGFSI